jgi:hypothetical protein
LARDLTLVGRNIRCTLYDQDSSILAIQED